MAIWHLFTFMTASNRIRGIAADLLIIYNYMTLIVLQIIHFWNEYSKEFLENYSDYQ